MVAPCCYITDSDALSASFGKLLNCKESADVVLMIGADRERLFAHSLILSHRSDFYRRALSPEWRHVVPLNSIDERADSNRDLAIIAHADVNPEAMAHVLQYIYSGVASVPHDLLVAVSSIAEEILVPDLSRRCLANFVERVLDEDNALS